MIFDETECFATFILTNVFIQRRILTVLDIHDGFFYEDS